MGHHINDEGQFQSDKYPDLGPDKIVLSFKDPRARRALRQFADDCAEGEPDLAADVRERLATIANEGPLRAWRLNEWEFYAAATLEEAIACAIELTGVPREDLVDDVFLGEAPLAMVVQLEGGGSVSIADVLAEHGPVPGLMMALEA